MKCLILDNYDSFTFNLRHILIALGVDTTVCRNDKISLDEVAIYDKILLSSGPGMPSEAGILLPAIQMYAPTKSILGIGLGEFAIGEAFGAKLLNIQDVYHGVCSDIRILLKDKLFCGLETGIYVGLYHSFIISKEEFPACLEITAIGVNTGYIMGIRHRKYDVRGLQFHPESILTPQGEKIIENWINN